MSATDEILAANHRYAARQQRRPASAVPRKKLAVIACMDARLDICRALGLRAGDAHVIRNAGGQVSDDALLSLFISQHLLATEEVVLIKHTGCGMAGLDEEEVIADLARRDLPAPPFRLGGFDVLDDAVRAGVARIRAAPYLPRREAVRGFVYEVETGRMREVG